MQIEELSGSNVPPEEFFREFVQRVATAVGAPAGAVWMVNGGGRLELLCETGLGDTAMATEPDALSANERIVREVMLEGQARAFSHESGKVELPGEHQLIIAPLRVAKRSIGAVEIFQRGDASERARLGFLQFVEQMCGHACRYLDRREKLHAPRPAVERNKVFEQFVLGLHGSLDVRNVTAAAAADGRLIVGCDRMGVATQRGKKTVVMAVSGQDAVNRRAKLVRSMEALIAAVIATRKPLLYTGKLDELPPQIEEPLAAYIEESGARMVGIWPLLEPEQPSKTADDDDLKKNAAPRKLIGGIIAEQFFESQPVPDLRENIELVSKNVSTAIFNAQSHERLFFLPFRRLVGHVRSLFEGRTLLKTLAVLLAVVCVVVALVVIPYDYRVEGRGHLMPVIQRSVFAPWDGEVVEVLVDNGDRVAKGQTLLQLKNDELHARVLAAQNELVQLQNRMYALQAEMDEAVGNARRDEEIRLEGELVKNSVEMEGTREQVAILEGEQAMLTVVAPIDGVVATFQLDRLLKNRPVRRGELLLEVMDDSGDWRLELDVDEHRMGHLLRAQQKSDNEHLPLEFVLATNVESTYSGRVELLSTRANKSQEGNIVQVFGTIEKDPLPPRQIGAEVEVKIDCGKRALGYVLFGDVVEFLQKHLWF